MRCVLLVSWALRLALAICLIRKSWHVSISNPGEAVKNAKSGQVRYRADKAGIIHCVIGKVSFDDEALKLNLTSIVS